MNLLCFKGFGFQTVFFPLSFIRQQMAYCAFGVRSSFYGTGQRDTLWHDAPV